MSTNILEPFFKKKNKKGFQSIFSIKQKDPLINCQLTLSERKKISI